MGEVRRRGCRGAIAIALSLLVGWGALSPAAPFDAWTTSTSAGALGNLPSGEHGLDPSDDRDLERAAVVAGAAAFVRRLRMRAGAAGWNRAGERVRVAQLRFRPDAPVPRRTRATRDDKDLPLPALAF